MKKRLLTMLSVLGAVAMFAGCGKSEAGSKDISPTAVVALSPTPELTKEPTSVPTPTAEPAPTAKPTSTPKPTATTAPTPTLSPDISNVSLKEIYKDDFLIGTIYNPWFETGVDLQLMQKHFNAITPENLMKPEGMQPKEGTFNYKDGDKMVAFAEANDLTVIGHTLAWHSQSGNFLGQTKDREKAIQQLKDHVTNVASHYDGQLLSWDVLNEAIRDGAKLPANGDWKSCLRDTQWTRSIGTDYVEMVFQFADEAAPNTQLYYNDYNLDDQNKAEIAAAMISDLRSKGIRVDGVGMQAHYNTGTNMNNVRKSLERFSSIEGLRISLTELDINILGANSVFTAVGEQKQAKLYAQLFSLLKEYADVVDRVTFWGLRDNNSWRKEGFPLLFNKDGQPKDSFFAVMDPEAYLESIGAGGETAPVAQVAEAVNGTPVIDGKIDDAYKSAKAYNVKTPVFAWQGATGTARMLWDEKNIYVLVEVADGVKNDSSPNDYEEDSVEIFLDESNTKQDSFPATAGHYRVNYKGKLSFGTVPTKTGIVCGASETASGYIIEIQIPIAGTAKKDMTLGFDLQVNDSDASGARISVMKFSDPTDNSYLATEGWGSLILK